MGWLRRIFGNQDDENEQSSPAQAPIVPEIGLETYEPAPPIVTKELPETDLPLEPVQTRPLPPPKEFKNPHRAIAYGTASDVGGRTNNEDASLTMLVTPFMAGNPPAIGLFAVADGMGGHENGEYASAITVQILAEQITNDVVIPLLQGQGPSSDMKTIPEVLADSLVIANDSIQAQFPGGGTTATCAVIRGDLAHIAHVGDSRAYLFTEGNLELVTRDHLLVRRLQELGQLSQEEADIHPQRNVLYRAVGQSEMLEVDAATRRMPPSSRLVLCSDGLWGVIGDSGIVNVLNQYPDNPQKACEELIAAANAQNGPDNITVVIVQMPE